MKKLDRTLLTVYLVAAAALGGWLGQELWSGWGIWCLLLPPSAWAALKAVNDWRRNPSWLLVNIGCVMSVIAVIAIGGCAMLLASMIAAVTPGWSSNPLVRALIGMGLTAAAFILILIGSRPRTTPDLQESSRHE